jgi:sortase (surface protein transpeptidase)
MAGARRRLLATIVGTVLAISGTAVVVIAMASQDHAPQSPASAAGSIEPTPSGSDGSSKVVELALPRSKPVAIDIPAIGVHSSLQLLGLNSDGTVEVPAGALFDVAGWYRYSPTPGSIGPAVILGHVDSGHYGASVFFKLGELRPGDRAMVTRRDGSVAVFEITAVRHYPKDHFPTKLVYVNTRNAALRLITCGGEFNVSTGHYVDNIIVFASLVGSR